MKYTRRVQFKRKLTPYMKFLADPQYQKQLHGSSESLEFLDDPQGELTLHERMT